jgi:methylated-DNA-[protein]-cysteine S-methyltransferase
VVGQHEQDGDPSDAVQPQVTAFSGARRGHVSSSARCSRASRRMSREQMPSRAVDTPIGTLGLVGSNAGLSRVLWSAKGLRNETSALLDEAAAQLAAYFAGDRIDFDLPLDLDGTEFQRQCWLALASIPYGQTVSYGEQARRLGLGPDAARAVGAANGQNPLPLVLPCHRVIGADGSLTGFGGGLHLKRFLLEHEGALLPLG